MESFFPHWTKVGLVLSRMFPGGMGFPSLRITIRDIAFGDLRGTFAVKRLV